MIIFYTHKEKTKVFAQALSQVINTATYQLETDLNNKSAMGFMFIALQSVFANRPYPVNNMPGSLPAEIYVCSPIWGGGLAAPVKYFLQNAKLAGIKVNLILTAASPAPKYEKNAIKYLKTLQCIVGNVYLFATTKAMPETDVLVEQFTELLN